MSLPTVLAGTLRILLSLKRSLWPQNILPIPYLCPARLNHFLSSITLGKCLVVADAAGVFRAISKTSGGTNDQRWKPSDLSRINRHSHAQSQMPFHLPGSTRRATTGYPVVELSPQSITLPANNYRPRFLWYARRVLQSSLIPPK